MTDYIKDSKTLNVNVLAEPSAGCGDQTMNNELNFDSDKFARHLEKIRPKETIENLVRVLSLRL